MRMFSVNWTCLSSFANDGVGNVLSRWLSLNTALIGSGIQGDGHFEGSIEDEIELPKRD